MSLYYSIILVIQSYGKNLMNRQAENQISLDTDVVIQISTPAREERSVWNLGFFNYGSTNNVNTNDESAGRDGSIVALDRRHSVAETDMTLAKLQV